ncbi:MAG: hypothetical protein RTU30_16345 [Candidatus Thorarchaeota archaeon]
MSALFFSLSIGYRTLDGIEIKRNERSTGLPTRGNISSSIGIMSFRCFRDSTTTTITTATTTETTSSTEPTTTTTPTTSTPFLGLDPMSIAIGGIGTLGVVIIAGLIFRRRTG